MRSLDEINQLLAEAEEKLATLNAHQAELLREQAAQCQREEAEKRRIKELTQLAKREAQAWQEVETLIQRSQAKAYDEAVKQLLKLRELAEFQNTQSDL